MLPILNHYNIYVMRRRYMSTLMGSKYPAYIKMFYVSTQPITIISLTDSRSRPISASGISESNFELLDPEYGYPQISISIDGHKINASFANDIAIVAIYEFTYNDIVVPICFTQSIYTSTACMVLSENYGFFVTEGLDYRIDLDNEIAKTSYPIRLIV